MTLFFEFYRGICLLHYDFISKYPATQFFAGTRLITYIASLDGSFPRNIGKLDCFFLVNNKVLMLQFRKRTPSSETEITTDAGKNTSAPTTCMKAAVTE